MFKPTPAPERCPAGECLHLLILNASASLCSPPPPPDLAVFVGAVCALSSTQQEVFLWIYWRNCLSDTIICLEPCESRSAGAGMLSHVVYRYTASTVPLKAP